MKSKDCHGPEEHRPKASVRRAERPVWDPAIARLTIDGLHCRHCAERIRSALLSAPEILGAEVDVPAGRVDVLFDASRLQLHRLADLIVAGAEDVPAPYAVVGARLF